MVSSIPSPPHVTSTNQRSTFGSLVVPTRSVVDEEALLTHIDQDSQEAIVSNLGLHWVNDIPGQSHDDQRKRHQANADPILFGTGSNRRRVETNQTRA